jgi:heme exporter protein CcmB
MLKQIFLRDVRAAWSNHGAAASGLAFFGMSYALMVMALGVEQSQKIQHALLAICVLLTIMLSLPDMLEEDARDGTLEQYVLLVTSRSWLMLTKIGAYWFSHVLPVLVLAVAIQWLETNTATSPKNIDNVLQCNSQQTNNILRLVLMSLWLTAVGSMSAVLALLHGRGTFARALIIIPLYVPALIVATLVDTDSNLILLQIAAILTLLPLAAWVGGHLLALTVD